MRHSIFLLVAFLAITIHLSAQKYTTAAGFRFGSGAGITVQQSIGGKNTIEGIVQYNFLSNATSVTALLEQHRKIISKATNFYYGIGPHVTFAHGVAGNKIEADYQNDFGLSLIGGVELKLGKTILSYDYKPAINLSGANRFYDGQSAISVRYVLIKAKKPERKPIFGFLQKNRSNVKK